MTIYERHEQSHTRRAVPEGVRRPNQLDLRYIDVIPHNCTRIGHLPSPMPSLKEEANIKANINALLTLPKRKNLPPGESS